MLSTELMKQQVIPLFLSPKGRVSRGLFWKSNLVLLIGFVSLFFCVMIIKDVFRLTDSFQDNGFSIAFIFCFYVAFVLTVKRLHDISWSGWFALPCILTGFLWLVVGMIVGTTGKSKHGENPVEYEKNRLFVNRGTGFPPPPPPIDNPISKIVLYVIVISFLPILAIGAVVSPKIVEKPDVEHAKELHTGESEVNSAVEEPKVEALPFVGERNFNFLGGTGTGEIITIKKNGHTVIQMCGDSATGGTCGVEYKGAFKNPILLKSGEGWLIKDNKIYSLEHGEIAKGCSGDDQADCSSELYSMN